MEAKCRKKKGLWSYGDRRRRERCEHGRSNALLWDLPLVVLLAEPVGETPEECLKERLGGPGVRGSQSRAPLKVPLSASCLEQFGYTRRATFHAIFYGPYGQLNNPSGASMLGKKIE